MMMSSPQTTSKSHSSLPTPVPPSFLSMNRFGYDQRFRNVLSASLARYFSEGVVPVPIHGQSSSQAFHFAFSDQH
jgi:hypothetical protein